MRSIQDYWTEFRQNRLSPVASPVQVAEVHLAFYCGVGAMLDAISQLRALDDHAESVYLASYYHEVRTFGRNS
ncbi:hypothetical protein [Paraburkholderia sp. HD33-4]|uniref:hypothetical protein n=1 Tax=Paraburkholderia sp. HD33-4 TaxID=2883242 RepID=UPI001F343A4F|nr:hypothetical protein [Paraburkholderia sp. HD33-4]